MDYILWSPTPGRSSGLSSLSPWSFPVLTPFPVRSRGICPSRCERRLEGRVGSCVSEIGAQIESWVAFLARSRRFPPERHRSAPAAHIVAAASRVAPVDARTHPHGAVEAAGDWRRPLPRDRVRSFKRDALDAGEVPPAVGSHPVDFHGWGLDCPPNATASDGS